MSGGKWPAIHGRGFIFDCRSPSGKGFYWNTNALANRTVRLRKNMSLIDKYIFEKRGGFGCSNSDYHLARTTCCGAFGVEDDDLPVFYIDAHDLSRVVNLFNEGEPCPFCGAKVWSFEHVEDFAAMPVEWRWAAPKVLTNENKA